MRFRASCRTCLRLLAANVAEANFTVCVTQPRHPPPCGRSHRPPTDKRRASTSSPPTRSWAAGRLSSTRRYVSYRGCTAPPHTHTHTAVSLLAAPSTSQPSGARRHTTPRPPRQPPSPPRPLRAAPRSSAEGCCVVYGVQVWRMQRELRCHTSHPFPPHETHATHNQHTPGTCVHMCVYVLCRCGGCSVRATSTSSTKAPSGRACPSW